MPHRPSSAGATTTAASPAYSRINGLSEEATAQIMRYPQQANMVTPLLNNKPWVSTKNSGFRGMVHSLENRKSSDSTDRSIATKHDDSTVATLATELSADEMEKRENIASALLLVSTAAVRHGSTAHETQEQNTAPSTSTGPPKKRKKHLDFLRRNSEEEHPCHVSPVSHGSVEGRTVSREEATPQRPGRVGPQAAHSYDSKDSPQYQVEAAQVLPDSAKIHNAKDISLPSQVVVPQFPAVLHQVLSDPKFTGSVLSWLPDGESWKVLRWDALRREVLPRYFSTLRDENGSGCGTIDAFLYHLTAWGFEEVKDGSAVGAYRHELFIRGAQKLSNKMHFVGRQQKSDHSAQGVKGEDRSMLQVPTLAMDSNAPNKRPRYEEHSHHHASGMRHPSPVQSAWPTGGFHYRTADPYSAEGQSWGQYYPDHSARMYPGTMYHDPRYDAPARRSAEPSYAPPPQVRSGRGAMRLPAVSRAAVDSAPPAAARSSFPVSNRGKGRKVGALSRTDSSAAEGGKASGTSSPVDKNVTLKEAQRIGHSVKGVAIAISRKTKRKLPLARNADNKNPTLNEPSSST